MLQITENNFEKEVVKHKGIIIIDNWAKWCQPCLRAAPIFEELSKELKNIRFAKLNVEEYPQLASSLGVMAIPTFIIYKDGKEIDRLSGFDSKESFKANIEKVIKK